MAGIYGIIGDISKHSIFKKTLLHQKKYVSNSIVINKNTCIGLIDLNFQNIDIFEKKGIRNLLNEHYMTERDYSKLIWQIINLEYFFRNFID